MVKTLRRLSNVVRCRWKQFYLPMNLFVRRFMENIEIANQIVVPDTIDRHRRRVEKNTIDKNWIMNSIAPVITRLNRLSSGIKEDSGNEDVGWCRHHMRNLRFAFHLDTFKRDTLDVIVPFRKTIKKLFR